MTTKQFFTYLITITVISCSDNSRDSNLQSTDLAKNQLQKKKIDSISRVNIHYYPSFTNSSMLQIDRLNNEGLFVVDTMIRFTYGTPDTIKFSIKDMEANTDLEKFWSSAFIQSIRQDTSMLGWTDGMSVYVNFINNGIEDSVYLGNVHPKRVDSVLMEQLNYIQSKTNNRAMNAYIKQVKEYLK